MISTCVEFLSTLVFGTSRLASRQYQLLVQKNNIYLGLLSLRTLCQAYIFHVDVIICEPFPWPTTSEDSRQAIDNCDDVFVVRPKQTLDKTPSKLLMKLDFLVIRHITMNLKVLVNPCSLCSNEPSWQWLVTSSAPSHYLNQCWIIVNCSLVNKFEWNQNTTIFIEENAFENGIWQMRATFSQHQCVKNQVPLHNTLGPRLNERYFAEDIFKWIFLKENVPISIKISLKFVPKGPINNIPALVQIMAWRRPGDKPLSEPMIVNLPTHICVTRPQWVNVHSIILTGGFSCVIGPHSSRISTSLPPAVIMTYNFIDTWPGEFRNLELMQALSLYWMTWHLRLQ